MCVFVQTYWLRYQPCSFAITGPHLPTQGYIEYPPWGGGRGKFHKILFYCFFIVILFKKLLEVYSFALYQDLVHLLLTVYFQQSSSSFAWKEEAVGRGGTPIHQLYRFVPLNGVVILKLLVQNGVSISEAFSRTGYNISNARKLHFCKQPFESIQGQIAFKNTVQCVNKQTVTLLLHPRTKYKKFAHFLNGVSVLGRILEWGIKSWPISRTGYQFQGKFFFRTGCQFGVLGGTYPPKKYPSASPRGLGQYFQGTFIWSYTQSSASTLNPGLVKHSHLNNFSYPNTDPHITRYSSVSVAFQGLLTSCLR